MKTAIILGGVVVPEKSILAIKITDDCKIQAVTDNVGYGGRVGGAKEIVIESNKSFKSYEDAVEYRNEIIKILGWELKKVKMEVE